MIKDSSALQRGVIIRHDAIEFGGIVRDSDDMVVQVFVLFSGGSTGYRNETVTLIKSKVLEYYTIQ